MLTEIIIENFQPWKYLRLVLTEGFTAIQGKSDKGKSAIVRLINWIINNRPSGFSFRKWNIQDEDVTRGTLIFSNGTVIREKSKEIDQYRLLLPNKKEKVFKTLNRQVPEEIKNFLNLDFYNIKNQFDQFFLLQESAGEVGRKFNEIVNLEIIDAVLKSINSLVSDAKSEKERSEALKGTLEHELKALSYLDDVKVELDKLEIEIGLFQETEESLTTVETILNDIKEYNEEIEELKRKTKHEAELNELIKEIDRFEVESAELDYIESICNEINEYAFDINEQSFILEFEPEIEDLILAIIEYSEQEEELHEIEEILDEIDELKEEISEKEKIAKYEEEIVQLSKDMVEWINNEEEIGGVDRLLFAIENYNDIIKIKEHELKSLEEEYEKMIKDGYICDKCGSVLNSDKLREMI